MSEPSGPRTIWVLGDQLSTRVGPLASARPGIDRVLMIESRRKLTTSAWHVQRVHLVITGMRRLAGELRSVGFDVDYRRADTLAQGLADHRTTFADEVVAMAPASWDGLELMRRLDVTVTANEQFLCDPATFAQWAHGRRLKMEDFYRWQRRRLGYLMDGDQPAEGRWNFDHENRRTPPRGHQWPEPVRSELDDIDRAVLADLPDNVWGTPPDGIWATSRAEALRRLEHAIEVVLPGFGPYEDAMTSTSWHLSHSLLSPYLNVGLLHPQEVCDAAEAAYRSGKVPIASAEGFIRQIIGWREYVWGVYWLWMPDYRGHNTLEATRPLPPLYASGHTQMRCVEHALAHVRQHAWTHHIERLMLLGNLSLLTGVRPDELVEWMWASFVDGAEWVMLPNVIGMALHADGGLMATKPYAAGGAYIDKMSDYCKGCVYDRRARVGPTACPFTTLYWDFLLRHAENLQRNPRVVQQVRAAQRLVDADAVRARAEEVLADLDAGRL